MAIEVWAPSGANQGTGGKGQDLLWLRDGFCDWLVALLGQVHDCIWVFGELLRLAGALTRQENRTYGGLFAPAFRDNIHALYSEVPHVAAYSVVFSHIVFTEEVAIASLHVPLERAWAGLFKTRDKSVGAA